jgi:hypothetical protein
VEQRSDPRYGSVSFAALSSEGRAQGTLSTEAQVDLIFLPLMRQTRPMAEVVRDAIDLARVLPIEEQRGTLAALLGLGARFLEQRDLEQLVEGLMSTVTGQQLLEQSFEEGRLSRAHEDILTILTARLGTPLEDLRRHIERLTEPQILNQMLVVAATAASIDAVRAQLP